MNNNKSASIINYSLTHYMINGFLKNLTSFAISSKFGYVYKGSRSWGNQAIYESVLRLHIDRNFCVRESCVTY